MTPHPGGGGRGVVMDQYTSDIMLNTTNNNPSLSSGIKKERIVSMNKQQHHQQQPPSTPIYPIYSGHTGFPVVSSNAVSSHFQLSLTSSPSTGVSCFTTNNNSILVKPDYQHNYSGNCNQSSILPCAEISLPFQHNLLDNNNNNNNSGVSLAQLLAIGGGSSGVGSIVQPSCSNIPCDFMPAASSSSSCILSNVNQSNHFPTPAIATPSIARAGAALAADGSTNTSNLYANQLNTIGRNNNNNNNNAIGVGVGKHHQTLSQQQQQDISPPRLLALPNSNNNYYMPHISSTLVEAAVYQHLPNLQKDSLYTNHNSNNNYFYNPYHDDDDGDDNHSSVGGVGTSGIQPASLVVDWSRNDLVSGKVGGHFTPIPYHPMPT
uniref:Uncharacterized protein n=1 Tax=Trichobilharzia regenti TaxID=157069 RepID=A0AA85J2S0_TRIRE|nr:unnamed protein product [Trichobilharzia regenti]